MSRHGGNRNQPGKGPALKGPAPKGPAPKVQPKALAPKPQPPKPVIPKAPPMAKANASPIAKANATLNAHEGGGRHSRERHVGMTDKQLKDRKIDTATSFKSAHDQNKAVGNALGTGQANKAINDAKSTKKNQAIVVNGVQGRTASIARVVQDGKAFNAKVTQTTVVMQKKTGKILTSYPSAGIPLPKPASGPNLKPATVNKSVGSIATGKANLCSVPKPVAKPLQLDGQKQFRNMTKNVKN